MIQKPFILSIIAIVMSTSSASIAQSTPPETITQTIVHNAQNPNSANVRLSKNIFRTETSQVHYSEQVPYQETETYTEQVPYTVQVPYQDTET